MRTQRGNRASSSAPSAAAPTLPFEVATFAVPALLQPWIKRIFVNRPTPQSFNYAFYRVPEVAAHLAFIASSNASDLRRLTMPNAARLMVSGVQRRLYSVPFPVSEAVVFVLRPGALRSLGLPCEELADQVMNVEAVGERWMRDATDEVAMGDCTMRRVSLVCGVLERQLRKADATTQTVRFAEGLVRACTAEARSRSLARAIGYSERQLRRISMSVLGVPPKDVTKILRINGVLRNSKDPSNWAATATQHGFHDQSHLVHEFRALLGDAPERFVQGLADRRLLREELVLRSA